MAFFNALSLSVKSALMLTFPGNHDFWVSSSPEKWTQADQLGNGFMQWYAQDTSAGYYSQDNAPFDFSIDPDLNPSAYNLPPLQNFFSYYKIGNVAIFGYSGAHTFNETLPYLEEACSWAQIADPAVILLLGHWNDGGYGCDVDMAVGNLYEELSTIPVCTPVASKMKYVM